MIREKKVNEDKLKIDNIEINLSSESQDPDPFMPYLNEN